MCVPLQYYPRMLADHSLGTSYTLTDFPRTVRFGRPTPALRLVTGGQPFHAGGHADGRPSRSVLGRPHAPTALVPV